MPNGISPLSELAALYSFRGRVLRVVPRNPRKLRGRKDKDANRPQVQALSVDCGVRLLVSDSDETFAALGVKQGVQVEGVGTLLAHFIFSDDVAHKDAVRIAGIEKVGSVRFGERAHVYRLLRLELVAQKAGRTKTV